VTNGTYIIDASAQLSGKQSMMNETAGSIVTGHEAHTMNGNNSSVAWSHDEHNMKSSTAKGEHAMLTVQGLCEMCKDRIEKTVKSEAGVISVSWDSSTKKLHFDFDPSKTTVDKVAKALAKVGHDNEKYKTDQATYDSLPACCKYRD
jgi:Cu(I)/Ag(I) efflux system membrane fusion protein